MSELRHPLDEMLDRLEAVGATPSELDEFAAQWSDPEFDAESKERLRRMNDIRLTQEVIDSRGVNAFHTTTPEQAAAAADDRAAIEAENALDDEALNVLASAIPTILDWIEADGDPGTLLGQSRHAKAARLYRLENAAADPRVTLIRELNAILEN